MSQTQQLSPADTMEAESPNDDKKIKSRRPPNTAFRQQRLKAFQPILTPRTVLPLFFVIGVVFAPLGGLMVWASSEVQEVEIQYQSCSTLPETGRFYDIPQDQIFTVFHASNPNIDQNAARYQRNVVQVEYGTLAGQYSVPSNQCTIEFNVAQDMHPPLFLYYRLTKFYQNHRRYVKSVDQDQLAGDFRDNATISSSDCDPLKTRVENGVEKAIYPCGLIANSLFNDTFSSPILQNAVNSSTNTQEYPMTNNSIAWSSDGDIFKKTVYTNDQVYPPPNWIKRYPNGTYNEQFPVPDIHVWEEFHNWMRTAGLPTFAKLALRNDNDVLRAGTYHINVTDDFPVNEYDGTKSILLSTRTVLGGKNPFLGIAYVVIGGVCLVLGLAFLAMHLVKPRKLGDHTYLSWNNDQQSTATTTGRASRPNEA